MTRAATFVLALGLAACSRPGLGDLTVYVQGDPELSRSGISDAGVWSSAPWACSAYEEMPTCADTAGCMWDEETAQCILAATDALTWLPFRPHEQVQVEHTLLYTPSVIHTYLSFVSTGDTPSESAGDLTRVVEVSETTITVWNDTNGTYFVRIVAF